MQIRISILGFGNIGKLITSLLLPETEHRFHINLMDPDSSVLGAIYDLQHAAELHPQHSIYYNNKAEFSAADFIFHCAGAIVPTGKSRLFTASKSIQITESIFKGVQFQKQPFIIVVANPVELISGICHSLSGLSNNRVMGTGTLLDSMRMNHLIRQEHPEFKHINAVLLGEHGASAFLSHQLSSIDQMPLSESLSEAELENLMVKVKSAADEIKATQGATIYGVSFCALKIFKALLSPEETLMPISMAISDELKAKLEDTSLHLSLLANVSKHGVFNELSYQPNESELEALQNSLNLLRPCLPKQYL